MSSTTASANNAPTKIAGIPINVLVPALITLAGCVLSQWYSVRSMAEQTAQALQAQQVAQATTVTDLRAAISTSALEIEKRMTERLTSAAQLQEANQRNTDLQRAFLESRLNSLESNSNTVRETPAALAALATRVGKVESALDTLQAIRLQLGGVENKLTSVVDSQAKLERTVDKLTAK